MAGPFDLCLAALSELGIDNCKSRRLYVQTIRVLHDKVVHRTIHTMLKVHHSANIDISFKSLLYDTVHHLKDSISLFFVTRSTFSSQARTGKTPQTVHFYGPSVFLEEPWKF